MESAYYSTPQADSFGSIAGLKRQTKSKLSDITTFLARQDAYTLHKDIRRKFPRRRTFTKGINDLWQMDIVDLSSLAQANDGYRYLLMCIDVLSKYARVVPLKTKSASSVRGAFATMIKDHRPILLQTDKGTEFLNSSVQSFLQDHHIKHYTSENDDIKCAIVERFNRTFLNKLFRYLTYKNTSRYLDALPDLTRSYNATYHSTIKMAPANVTLKDERQLLKRMFPPKPKHVEWKFEIGDTVRISETRRAFTKGYREKWTEELFLVSERYKTDPPTYGLVDMAMEPIKGKFYAAELQKTVKDVFHIEKVLKKRKRGGKEEYYVKWFGYSDKFNSWVTDISTV